jgi:hypothetical protein
MKARIHPRFEGGCYLPRDQPGMRKTRSGELCFDEVKLANMDRKVQRLRLLGADGKPLMPALFSPREVLADGDCRRYEGFELWMESPSSVPKFVLQEWEVRITDRSAAAPLAPTESELPKGFYCASAQAQAQDAQPCPG